MKKMKQPSKTTQPLRWVWRISAGTRWEVLLLLILNVISGGSGVALAWTLRNMIDKAVARDGAGFLRQGGLFRGVILLQLLVGALIRRTHEHASATLENRLKKRLFETLLYKDYASVTRLHSGEWMNRLVSDTTVTANAIVSIVPQMSGMLVMLVSAVGAVLVMLKAAMWAIVPAGVIISLMGYLFRKKLKAMHKDIRQADGKVRVLLSERLSELMIVRSFRREQTAVRQAEGAMAEAERELIEELQRDSGNKYQYVQNINQTIGMMRNRLLQIVAAKSPRRRNMLYRKLLAETRRNLVPVRSGRSFPRGVRHKSAHYSHNTKQA